MPPAQRLLHVADRQKWHAAPGSARAGVSGQTGRTFGNLEGCLMTG
jgi:hypothetical protein